MPRQLQQTLALNKSDWKPCHSFEPTQQEAIQLTFVDDEDLLPRSDAVNAFLLMSYTIQ